MCDKAMTYRDELFLFRAMPVMFSGIAREKEPDYAEGHSRFRTSGGTAALLTGCPALSNKIVSKERSSRIAPTPKQSVACASNYYSEKEQKHVADFFW